MISTLLRQLLDDAPSAEIDAEIVSSLSRIDRQASGAQAEAKAEIALVIELRGMLETLRRRSQELRALFDTAGDLSAMRDEQQVLTAIVRRSRQLLHTDIAYLMLVDKERGDTYMRVTEGTTGKGFSDIRLPLGSGVAGQIAEEGIPLWTRDYLADTRHARVIDDAVEEEQVVAILGVPLRVGARVIGVLFAADRAERNFSPEEVSLLSSLADHAAIAIENATRFEEKREALEALETATAAIESNNRRLTRAVDLHERLMTLVVNGSDPQDLIDAMRETLSARGIVVWDDHRSVVGRSLSPGADAAIDEFIAQARSDNRRERTATDLAGDAGLAIPIVAAGQVLGTLYYVGPHLDEHDARTLERGISAISVLLLNRRAHDEADNRLRGEILAELLMKTPGDLQSIRRRAGLLEVDLDQPFVVLVMVPDTEMSGTLQSEVGGFARAAGGLASSYADRIVALVPHAWSPHPASEAVRRLRHIRLTVGAAGPSTDLADLIDMEDRAHRAANLLIALGRVGDGASADELGVFGLLLSQAEPTRIRQFVSTQLDRVRRYDAEKDTALLPTMTAYFAAECSTSETATRLFIHVNTVYQRLERLDQLLGDGWRTGDRALELRLALRMEQLLSHPE